MNKILFAVLLLMPITATAGIEGGSHSRDYPASVRDPRFTDHEKVMHLQICQMEKTVEINGGKKVGSECDDIKDKLK